MVDALKDGVTAWLERVKSPIAGSIILSFVAVNWQSIWFVVWSDVEATERFLYFDEHTSPQSLYLWPLLIGFLLGILGPWLRWFGTYTANYPTKKYREIEDKQASDLRVAAINWNIEEQTKREELQKAAEQAELAAAKAEEAADQRKIARAERIKSADDLEDGAAADSIRASFQVENKGSSQPTMQEYINSLIPVQKAIIDFLAPQNREVDMQSTAATHALLNSLAKSNPTYSKLRIETELHDGLRSLEGSNAIVRGSSGHRLTPRGYEIYDLLQHTP